MTVITDLDEAILTELRLATGRRDLGYAASPVPLRGGFWAELRAISLTGAPADWPAELVARVMPDAGTARKETIVQAAMAAAGFPTPRIRVSGGPSGSIGQAFMVMDKAPGAPLLPGLSGASAVLTALRAASRLPDVLASTMARLHALDPEPVRSQLSAIDDVPVTEAGMIATLADLAAQYQHADLAGAANWLISHPLPPMAEVTCHGDLHPFNLLADGDEVCVLDWSASLLAPRGYDVAFTSLMLAEPPLAVPAATRPAIRLAGRLMARQFVRRYQARAGVTISQAELRWHQGVVSLRVLTDVAGWIHGGAIGNHVGHPWLLVDKHAAARLSALTGIAVRPAENR